VNLKFTEKIPGEHFVLTAMFPYEDELIAVWTDYSAGALGFSKFARMPDELSASRPLIHAFKNDYKIDKTPQCGKLLNYGPAAGGIGEAGAFKIATCGERIEELVPLRGYKAGRAFKRKIVKNTVQMASPYLSRLSGQFSASYYTLFTKLAFEDVDERLERLCFAATELERIHNHVWVMHKLANDAAQKVASAHLAALTEELLRLNSRVFGNRYLIDFARLYRYGEHESFATGIKSLKREFLSLADELLRSRIVIDRLHTTATLTPEQIKAHDIMGIPARAAGVKRDARKFSVLQSYHKEHVPKLSEDGDSLARLLVRVEEVKESFELLENFEFPKSLSIPNTPADGTRYGIIEAPPGDIFMLLDIESGHINWLGIRPPSLVMLHAFSVGIRGNVFTDFPFALDSFGLYFADADIYGGWS